MSDGGQIGRDGRGVWQRAETDSPCVQICMLHPDAKICIGCYRTSAEIAGWSRMNAADRTAVRAELPGRAALIGGRRGGRARRRGAGPGETPGSGSDSGATES